MPQRPIELILMRQLAATLAMPIFLVDPAGTLVFFNPAAEAILGVRFDETGEMPANEWGERWDPLTDEGDPLPADRLPLSVAVSERRAIHGAFWITAHGTRRRIEVTAIPLIVVTGEVVGAAAFFWETPR